MDKVVINLPNKVIFSNKIVTTSTAFFNIDDVWLHILLRRCNETAMLFYPSYHQNKSKTLFELS